MDKVLEELNHFFSSHPDPDYITFSGAGEPTLNIRFGEVLRFIKQKKPEIPLAVLTNGSLLYQKEIREEMMLADLVLPSLDAATEEAFRKLDRPVKDININRYISGLVEFRKAFKGKIWLEVFILPGYNDDMDNLKALREAILKIQPDKVQVNTLDRPGTKPGLLPASREQLQNVLDLWGFENAEIIASAAERKDIISYRDDMEDAILETIVRRPCTVEDIAAILGTHVNEVNKYLGVLEEEGKIMREEGERGVFYRKKI